MLSPAVSGTRTSCTLLLLVALMAPGALSAAEMITLEDECNGRQLLLKGPIEPGDYDRFVAHLAELVTGGRLPDVQNPDVLWTVQLDSPGGDLGESMRIGRLLRRALATTEVGYRFARRLDGVYDFQKKDELVCLDGEGGLSGCDHDLMEAECTGACLLIWLAGAERHANEGRLGLHGLAGNESETLRAYLEDMAVPAEWVPRMLSAGGTGDGWLSWPERHELSGRAPALEALVQSCPDPLTRDESFRSVTASNPAVRDRLMDRAESHRRCRRRHLADVRASVVARLNAGSVLE